MAQTSNPLPAVPKEESPKHTPGPWKIESDIDGRSWGYIYPENGEVLPGGSRPPAVARVCHSRPQSATEVYANAHLIAAAPDLLEALKLLYEGNAEYIRLNHLGEVHHNRSMQMARDAIAKAEGK